MITDNSHNNSKSLDKHILILSAKYQVVLMSQLVPITYREAYSIQLMLNVCKLLVVGRLFFPGTLIPLTNKTDLHDITGIFLVNRSRILKLFQKSEYAEKCEDKRNISSP